MNSLLRKKSVSHILKEAKKTGEGAHQLNKTLSLRDLTAMGIAAIIGAGIFSTIGNASASGGPAVILLFIFTAIACGFSAMSYAEFASSIPISGSAYTYAYAAFGEIIAWIIGWALILEYGIGNIVVAISWSDYFTGLLAGLNIHIPAFLTMDYATAKEGFAAYNNAIFSGQTIAPMLKEQFLAWQNAPQIGSLKIIFDLPAVGIVLAITALIYRGVHETKKASNLFVAIKLFVIVLVIIVGAFYINPENWSPFMPNKLAGVLQGVSSVFFAYIGFDALATTAEECKNPERDLPKSMIASLIICTVLYILISLTLTGMVSYKQLAVGDPLSFVFSYLNVTWMSGIVAVSAVIAMASVLLVFQNGQPRIWMSMSRDGLLPKKFSAIHPKYKTPYFSTLITGALVAIPALFMNLREVTDLSSIGTLFAFVLVNAGVIQMETHRNADHKGFRVPYISGRIILPLIYLVSLFLFIVFDENKIFLQLSWAVYFPAYCFWILFTIMAIFSFLYRFSLLPVLGMITNFYLMTQLGKSNWIAFGLWLIIGLMIYFVYSQKHSNLNTKKSI
jgi:APA family basic amino acid/polyamine antiporter